MRTAFGSHELDSAFSRRPISLPAEGPIRAKQRSVLTAFNRQLTSALNYAANR